MLKWFLYTNNYHEQPTNYDEGINQKRKFIDNEISS